MTKDFKTHTLAEMHVHTIRWGDTTYQVSRSRPILVGKNRPWSPWRVRIGGWDGMTSQVFEEVEDAFRWIKEQ